MSQKSNLSSSVHENSMDFLNCLTSYNVGMPSCKAVLQVKLGLAQQCDPKTKFL